MEEMSSSMTRLVGYSHYSTNELLKSLGMALLRGYLYVVADTDRQFAKIGMSRDADSRLHATRAFCPLELELVTLHPCTYARFREYTTHKALKDLHLHNEWFRWDEDRIRTAIAEALGVSDQMIKSTLRKRATYDYAVRRVDTGEMFTDTKTAALMVLGSKKLAVKIRKAVKDGAKCGPTFWSRV